MSDIASAIYDIARNDIYTPDQAKALIRTLLATSAPSISNGHQPDTIPTPTVVDKPRNGEVPLGDTISADGRRATIYDAPPFLKPPPAPLTPEQQKMMEKIRRSLNEQAERVVNSYQKGTWNQ